jgi:AraC-like DNA-binding protein
LARPSITIPPRWREPAFHPTYTRLLCTVLHRALPDASETLDCGLDLAQLARQQSFVSFEVSSRLILEGARLSGCPWLGMELGAIAQVSAHGSLGYAAASSRDVLQALEVVSRFVGLRTRAMELRVSPHQDNTDIVIRERFDFGEARVFILEAVLVMIVRMIEWLSGQSMQRAEYQLPYARPPWVEKYAQVLKGRLQFGASCLRISAPNDILCTPCLSADPVAYASACRECEQKLAILQGDDSLAQNIRNRLREREGDYPTLESLADDLHVSPRTLIRRLKQEGVSYHGLLDEVRKDLAEWYLLNSYEPVEAIAERLGYMDTSNFSRTFRRWFGVSPARFRQAGSQPANGTQGARPTTKRRN